jgi:hypothetical protein
LIFIATFGVSRGLSMRDTKNISFFSKSGPNGFEMSSWGSEGVKNFIKFFDFLPKRYSHVHCIVEGKFLVSNAK